MLSGILFLARGARFWMACVVLFAGASAYAVESVEAGALESLKFTEVSRQASVRAGHKTTLVRVGAPLLPLPKPAPIPMPPTAEELEAAMRQESKAYVMLDLRTTLYLDGARVVTELRWSDGAGGLRRAWSNVDFRHLATLGCLETETAFYSWFPFFLDVVDLRRFPDAGISATLAGLSFGAIPGYLVEENSGQADEITLGGLDYLHAYYQLHGQELAADYRKLRAEAEAREKALRKNPPKRPDTVVRYWSIRKQEAAR